MPGPRLAVRKCLVVHRACGYPYYHNGDDTYTINFSSAGDNGVRRTIWDAGGNDMIDASGYTISGATIDMDLRPGSLNSFYPISQISIVYGVTIDVIGSAENNVLTGHTRRTHITLAGS